jgi:hypothetical protein
MDDRQTRLALSCALLAALAGLAVQAILLLRAATVATHALPGAVSAEFRVTRTDLIGQVARCRAENMPSKLSPKKKGRAVRRRASALRPMRSRGPWPR